MVYTVRGDIIGQSNQLRGSINYFGNDFEENYEEK
jgi:hypothetical protein